MENKEEKITKGLISIVTPITIQYLMSSLVSASDAFMLGFLDQSSLSASSLATQVAFVYSLFFGAFTFGLNVLAAQYWGKNDKRTVSKVLGIALRYSLISGLIFTLATLIIPRQIMYIFTSDAKLVKAGAKYLRVVSLSFVLTGFTQCYLGCMKVCNKATLSSIIGSSAVVVNIGLNAVFIFGLLGAPKMGIAGAAFATVCSRIFEMICILVAIVKGKCIKASIGDILRTKERVLHSDYWKYTVPLLINQLGWGGGVTMYSVIMGHLGSDAVAANSIANIVRTIIASFCWGVAAGVAIILGNVLGSGDFEKAKKLGGKFVRMSLVIGVISGLVILALIPVITAVIELSPKAMSYLKVMLMFSAYYIIGNALNSTIITGIFPSGGDTKFGMICDVITLWLVIVPAGLLAAFVFKWPVLVVAFILTLDEFVKIPAVYKHYMKFKWVKNITRDF